MAEFRNMNGAYPQSAIQGFDVSEIDLSIVIPLYNEEDNVELLCVAIEDALSAWQIRYEVIFIDDGSSDSTFDRACRAIKCRKRFCLLKMRRNHGQTTAMAAGIEFARADVIVTMDGDLQNDPHDIRVLYEVLMNGYDIVVGWREKRRDKLITRRIPSVAANWLIARLTRTRVHDNGCTLKCFNAQLIKNIPLYSELHRFIPALASVFGARLIEVKVNHHARIHGSSKYSLSRIHKVIVDLLSVSLIVRAARWPMIWAISASIMPLAASAVIGAITLWEYWFDTPQRSLIVPTALSLLALNLGGFMFSLGLLSELIFKFAAVSPAQFPKFTMRSYERKI